MRQIDFQKRLLISSHAADIYGKSFVEDGLPSWSLVPTKEGEQRNSPDSLRSINRCRLEEQESGHSWSTTYSTTLSFATQWQLLKVLCILLLTACVAALVPCTSNKDYQALLKRSGPLNPQVSSTLVECISGHSTNPYQNGCLINRKEGWKKLRTCNSDDPPNVTDVGLCRNSRPGLEHMEIRI